VPNTRLSGLPFSQAVLALLLFAAAAHADIPFIRIPHQGGIGINFEGGDGPGGPSPLYVPEVNSDGTTVYWNNAAGASGTMSLIDGRDKATTAVLTYQADGLGITSIPRDTARERLMAGFLDTPGGWAITR
jgi:hypothetical protein